MARHRFTEPALLACSNTTRSRVPPRVRRSAAGGSGRVRMTGFERARRDRIRRARRGRAPHIAARPRGEPAMSASATIRMTTTARRRARGKRWCRMVSRSRDLRPHPATPVVRWGAHPPPARQTPERTLVLHPVRRERAVENVGGGCRERPPPSVRRGTGEVDEHRVPLGDGIARPAAKSTPAGRAVDDPFAPVKRATATGGTGSFLAGCSTSGSPRTTPSRAAVTFTFPRRGARPGWRGVGG
jgi:hypothetical protein